VEIKVPSRDEVHEKMTKRGVKPVFELWTPGGLKEFVYDRTNFYDLPMVVTEYAQDSFTQAIDENLEESPEDYAIEMRWFPGWADWDPKGKEYPDFAGSIPATTDWRLAQAAFNVPGKLDQAIEDFYEIFGIEFVKVRQDNIGEWVAVSDAGLVLSENIDDNNPSPIQDNFGGGLLTAFEVKVPDRDATDAKLAEMNVRPIFELWTPGGLREFYYDKTNFHDIPLVVTEYATDSFVEAIDKSIEENPEAYAVNIKWAEGYQDWQPKK
jgi:hypothetical protein